MNLFMNDDGEIPYLSLGLISAAIRGLTSVYRWTAMGRNKQVECPVCGKGVRSDVLTRHIKTHEREKAISKRTEARRARHSTLKDQLRAIVGEENLDILKHVFHRDDCYTALGSREAVKNEFDIPHNLVCTCGATKDCSNRHRHFMGIFKKKGSHYGRTLNAMFTEKKAFVVKGLKGSSKGAIADRIEQVKHFFHCACYIQTLRGWHKKIEQENEYVFETLEDNKKFLAEFYSEWMWAQVTYMRHLFKKIEGIERVLEHADLSDEVRCKMERQVESLDDKIKALEKVWGEEHHYTDEELSADLNRFLDECKNM